MLAIVRQNNIERSNGERKRPKRNKSITSSISTGYVQAPWTWCNLSLFVFLCRQIDSTREGAKVTSWEKADRKLWWKFLRATLLPPRAANLRDEAVFHDETCYNVERLLVPPYTCTIRSITLTVCLNYWHAKRGKNRVEMGRWGNGGWWKLIKRKISRFTTPFVIEIEVSTKCNLLEENVKKK